MIQKQFRFTFKLGRQWCFASVCHGVNSVDVEASYICEPLGDLATALTMLYKSPGWQRTAIWLVEPGQFRWLLDRDKDQVRMRVLWLPHGKDIDSDLGDLLLDTTAPLKRVATQVCGQMRQVLDDWGAGGYQEQWGRDFPFDQLCELADAIEKADK